MTKDKIIVIGCDDTSVLPMLLNGLRGTADHLYSVTRTSDLCGIIKSLRPQLVISHFRNSQLALNTICAFVNRIKIPVLCLTRELEDKSLSWNKKAIVFTYPVKYVSTKNYLQIRIGSILRLIAADQRRVGKSFLTDTPHYHTENLSKNLARYVMELGHKEETLIKTKKQIKELYPVVDDSTKRKLIAVVNTIKVATTDKKHWEDFKVYFENVNPMFIRQLSERHPALTSKDVKYCCYLRMNMSNSDIRHLLGINQESVRMHKYRLKNKMALLKDQDLRLYVNAI